MQYTEEDIRASSLQSRESSAGLTFTMSCGLEFDVDSGSGLLSVPSAYSVISNERGGAPLDDQEIEILLLEMVGEEPAYVALLESSECENDRDSFSFAGF